MIASTNLVIVLNRFCNLELMCSNENKLLTCLLSLIFTSSTPTFSITESMPHLLPWVFQAIWMVVSIFAVSLWALSVHTESLWEMACENSTARSSLSLLYSWSTHAHTLSHSFFPSLSLSYASKWIPAPTDHSPALSSVFIEGSGETSGSAVLGWKISLHYVLLPTHGPESAGG